MKIRTDNAARQNAPATAASGAVIGTAARFAARPRAGVVALGVVLAALALASGCGAKKADGTKGDADAASEESTTPVRLAATDIATAARTDLSTGIPVSGTLAPSVDVRINAPLLEILDRVYVREGEAVKQGQPIARFRTTSIEPDAASADAELKMRAADRERMQNLLKEGAVSERDLESAEAAWRAAAARQAQAASRLADATVRAPVSGVIAERVVQAGDRVADGDPMFRLVNTRELEFEATVPSEYVQHVKPGAPVSLTITGYTRGLVEGHVARVNASADPATRQVKVYVTVANSDNALVGGLFASGSILTQQTRNALAVPPAAVRTDGDARWVMVVARGHLARRAVTVGLHDDARDRVEILAGLAAGDTVVTGPIEGLTPGRNAIVSGKER